MSVCSFLFLDSGLSPALASCVLSKLQGGVGLWLEVAEPHDQRGSLFCPECGWLACGRSTEALVLCEGQVLQAARVVTVSASHSWE